MTEVSSLTAKTPVITEHIHFPYFLNRKVCVALTAYNDQDAILPAVKEFISQENVVEVIVVDNNSRDKTSERAVNAGAKVVHEKKQIQYSL